VREAISDTGPILHLHEIGQQAVLGIFECLIIPDLVAEELRTYGFDVAQLDIVGLTFSLVPVAAKEWQAVVQRPEAPPIQPADAQVFVLAQASQFQQPVLTDDLTLRRHLETHGAAVVGSMGVLVRAYRMGQLQRPELEEAVEALFDQSTLHLSRAFRAYMRQLLASLS
jgi:predicted nucleic acid-binding protein